MESFPHLVQILQGAGQALPLIKLIQQVHKNQPQQGHPICRLCINGHLERRKFLLQLCLNVHSMLSTPQLKATNQQRNNILVKVIFISIFLRFHMNIIVYTLLYVLIHLKFTMVSSTSLFLSILFSLFTDSLHPSIPPYHTSYCPFLSPFF